MMSQVTARLPDEQIDALDQLVDEGRYASRSEAVRDATRQLLVAERQRREHGTTGETLISDGGQEQVWIRGASSGKSQTHYHTDPDCAALARATGTVRKPRAVLADDLRECARCAGTAASPPGCPPTTIADRLDAMDPDDLDSQLSADGRIISDGGRDR